ncbi:MAG: hypothetical protein EOO20_27870 [Chryseobacterium sp.]|nr:MAG: hypothetical protein EOO20_27870 [Chryseobacterium sp.]
MNTTLGKIPPQALELEKAVLGAILIQKSAYSRVSDIISAESFYFAPNEKIYRAISTLAMRSSGIDILTVTAELRLMGQLEFVGGPFYVTNLTNGVSSSANIVDPTLTMTRPMYSNS